MVEYRSVPLHPMVFVKSILFALVVVLIMLVVNLIMQDMKTGALINALFVRRDLTRYFQGIAFLSIMLFNYLFFQWYFFVLFSEIYERLFGRASKAHALMYLVGLIIVSIGGYIFGLRMTPRVERDILADGSWCDSVAFALSIAIVRLCEIMWRQLNPIIAAALTGGLVIALYEPACMLPLARVAKNAWRPYYDPYEYIAPILELSLTYALCQRMFGSLKR